MATILARFELDRACLKAIESMSVETPSRTFRVKGQGSGR
jgi:hypothetical protein